ncbi:MAG: glycosyltransferase family 4 protein [Ilyomonas sp.]
MNKTGRLKILYVQSPAGGGSLLALYELLRQLDYEKVSPVVLCYYRSRYTPILESINGCKVIYFEDESILRSARCITSGSSILNFLLLQFNSLVKFFCYDRKVVRYIRKIIKTEKPDLVHHFTDVMSNRQAIVAAWRASVPQLLFNHSLASYRRNYVDYWIDYFLIRSINYHIHMTEAVFNHFKKLFPSIREKSCVMNDFVDIEKFKATIKVDLLRNELGLSEGAFVISNIGRLTEWKGQHVLIEAINSIKKQIGNFKVLIVGPYDEGVGSVKYFESLKKLSCRYGLSENFFFTGNREDIAEIINVSDIIVHTAIKPEPQGIVILEAMLCNKPVIATNAGGAAELVKKYGGTLVEPNDAEELGKVLLSEINKVQTGFYENNAPVDYYRLYDDMNPQKKVERLMRIYENIKK